MTHIPNLSIQEQAKHHVFTYIKAHLEKTDTHVTFSNDDVYVVWFAKTLQNWKALVSSTLPDGMYYEVTYNGDKCETYIDAYKKFDNVLIPDGNMTEPKRILPEFDFVLGKELETAVYQALGAASVCWESMECTGVFQTHVVSQIAEELIGIIVQFAQSYPSDLKMKVNDG